MISVDPQTVEWSESWQDDDQTARWRSGPGHSPSKGADSSGSSLLEVAVAHRLPLHTDSAEETIVVISGTAEVRVGDEAGELPAGALAVIPKCVPHEVRNAGRDPLRFVAVYAEPNVVTTYEREVQPDGSTKRQTVD